MRYLDVNLLEKGKKGQARPLWVFSPSLSVSHAWFVHFLSSATKKTENVKGESFCAADHGIGY